MTRVIDLDQLRAEANDEPVEVHVSGRTFTLPAILPVSLALEVDVLAQADKLDPLETVRVFRTLVDGLVGADHRDALLGLVSLQELQQIVTTAYGLGIAESRDSVVSSGNGGMRSSQTSPVTTTSS